MDFPEDYRVQVIDGEISISYGDTLLLYKEVSLTESSESIESLHHCLRKMMESHKWFPTVLFPFTYNHQLAVMVKVVNSKPLSQFAAEWFFPRINVPTGEKSSVNSRLYASVSFKRLILSIVKTSLTFMDKAFRPILDAQCMYIGVDNNVVFTSFEKREAHHHWQFETKELADFFTGIRRNKAKDSETIFSEMKSFVDWLEKTNYDDLFGDITGIFENVIFWDDEIRVRYIIDLYDSLENGKSIYPAALDAFAEFKNFKNSKPTNKTFRDMISTSNNVILKKVQMKADVDYDAKDRAFSLRFRNAEPPSWRRSSIVGRTRQSILEQGLTRLGDSYRHSVQLCEGQFTLEDMQHMYQYLFPIHMIAFAKLQRQIQFEVKSKVVR